ANHVARVQGHDRRDVADEVGIGALDVAGRVVLTPLAVDVDGDLQVVGILNLVPGHDPRPEAGKGVEGLAQEAGDRVAPEPARRDVVVDGVAKDGVHHLVFAQVLALAPHHHRDLGLVVEDRSIVRRQDDGIAIADDRFGRFEEEVKDLNRAVGALAEVADHADDLGGPGERGLELDVSERLAAARADPALQLGPQFLEMGNQIREHVGLLNRVVLLQEVRHVDDGVVIGDYAYTSLIEGGDAHRASSRFPDVLWSIARYSHTGRQLVNMLYTDWRRNVSRPAARLPRSGPRHRRRASADLKGSGIVAGARTSALAVAPGWPRYIRLGGGLSGDPPTPTHDRRWRQTFYPCDMGGI